MIFPLPLCVPITWSIDTTGLSHPARSSIAAKKAVKEWADLTGLPIQYVPSGGVVNIVFRVVDKRWAAYAMEDNIVVDPSVANAAALYQREVIAHEFGHVLGVGHVGGGLMGGFATHVTPADAKLVSVVPCQ